VSGAVDPGSCGSRVIDAHWAPRGESVWMGRRKTWP